MDERASKVFAGLSVLVLLWIGVYWLWEPSTARVSFGGETPADVTPATSSGDETPPNQGEKLTHGPAVAPPGFYAYTLRAGDTFESIAHEQWGDGALWSVVARANPLKDPNRLKSGQVIRLPIEIGNIQGVALAPLIAPGVEVKAPERTHTVQSGDTLSSIAQRYLGSGADAHRVYDLNRDRLRDMHSLKIGQELRVPPAGSGG